MSTVYVLTDVYQGEPLETSVFPTFDEARDRFGFIIADRDTGLAEVETDYEDTLCAYNESGRVVRVSAPHIGAWVLADNIGREAIRLRDRARAIVDVEMQGGYFDADAMHEVEDAAVDLCASIAESIEAGAEEVGA